ncbi:M20/M25/M40 family metallo-hydrolase [Agriterribacter sp.]|uniref:M20/M25/M40 family metallo-hydrolase n=1 Tax=Agriterribacter sp. TaxID=2821509 RepID=UPI002BA04042|nr:M20/M25/M40 family metallo-hydrolase [Agriterribacter sp.]HTN07764.1 M20/M25/M40 family metallo-hydrolase [Agriterribacter sp.]
MKPVYVSVILMFTVLYVSAQKMDRIITVKKVEKIEKILSADDMGGRGLFTPGIDKAAAFIAKEFRKAGLQPLPSSANFFQEFTLVAARQISAKGTINGQETGSTDIIAFTSKESLIVNEQSGYETVKINAADRFFNTAYGYIMSGKNYVVWVDTAHSKSFPNLNQLKRERFRANNSVIFVLTGRHPSNYSFSVEHEITEKKLKNVVGVLPGKSLPAGQTGKKEDYVIFSGHYDHLGTGKPDATGDSIYNGANDDAAGITAVIMLAKYFKKIKNNERTLVFAAFTAEETGGFGSQYFSLQLEPDKVTAMFNIEMIGTDSKWGKNSAYITGYEKTDMGEILAKNLQGTAFTFHPDPYPDQQLFYRSDNATLARLGVPAHTISTSKMDSEPYYHTPGDEFSTLDIKNMTEIIKAIALSSASIVSGADTPTRVDTLQLR